MKRESCSVEVIFQIVGFETVDDIGFPPGAETEGAVGRDKIYWRIMKEDVVVQGIVLTATNELEGIPTLNPIFKETRL